MVCVSPHHKIPGKMPRHVHRSPPHAQCCHCHESQFIAKQIGKEELNYDKKYGKMLAKYGKTYGKNHNFWPPRWQSFAAWRCLGATEGSWEQSLLSRLKSSMPASSSKFKTSTKPVTNYLKLHLLTLHLLFSTCESYKSSKKKDFAPWQFQELLSPKISSAQLRKLLELPNWRVHAVTSKERYRCPAAEPSRTGPRIPRDSKWTTANELWLKFSGKRTGPANYVVHLPPISSPPDIFRFHLFTL